MTWSASSTSNQVRSPPPASAVLLMWSSGIPSAPTPSRLPALRPRTRSRSVRECPVCERQLARRARYCPNCGLRLFRTRRQKIGGVTAILVGTFLGGVTVDDFFRSGSDLLSAVCVVAGVLLMGGILILLPVNWSQPMTPADERVMDALEGLTRENRWESPERSGTFRWESKSTAVVRKRPPRHGGP